MVIAPDGSAFAIQESVRTGHRPVDVRTRVVHEDEVGYLLAPGHPVVKTAIKFLLDLACIGRTEGDLRDCGFVLEQSIELGERQSDPWCCGDESGRGREVRVCSLGYWRHEGNRSVCCWYRGRLSRVGTKASIGTGEHIVVYQADDEKGRKDGKDR